MKKNMWRTAALLKDRTRREIRSRHRAGEPCKAIAYDYFVPVAFVEALVAWQIGGDEHAVSLTITTNVAQGGLRVDPVVRT